MSKSLSRRTVLRGLGVSMALPWLQIMSPGSNRVLASTIAPGPTAPPVRLAFVFMPNGVNYDAWVPTMAEGAGEASAFSLKGANLGKLARSNDRAAA